MPAGIRAAGQDVEAVDAQPERRVVGPAHDVPGLLVGVDVRAPGQRLVGDPHARARRPGRRAGAAARRSGRRRRRRPGRPPSRPASGRCPARSMTSNLRSARRRLAANRSGSDGVEVAERLVEVDRQAEVGAAGRGSRRASSGETTRSGSKISTPSNPAAAAAASLSSSVPEMQTVASAVRSAACFGWVLGGRRRAHGHGHGRPRLPSARPRA